MSIHKARGNKRKRRMKKQLWVKKKIVQTCQEYVSKSKHLIITAIVKGRQYMINSKICFKENLLDLKI